MTQTPEPHLPFDRLGDYDVLAPISEGGMASVWLGRRRAQPTELVALKVVRAEHGRNKEFVTMLVDEAAIASRLSHPNILPVRSLGDDGERLFLVMDLLRGHTLLALWNAAHARGRRLPIETVAWMGARIADALHYAHERKDDRGAPLNVVHRDVNPANIFVTAEGVPKLIDFGLAKARDCVSSTAVGIVKGKLAYLAPEQTHGRPADRRSDVFALGVALWEITLDRRLFLDDSDVETVRRVRETQVPDPTTLMEGYPPALAKVLCRALARDPDERWQTAADLRDELDAFARSTGHPVDASNVRAFATEVFAGEAPARWERIADEARTEHEQTRIWDERKETVRDLPAIEAAGVSPAVKAPELRQATETAPGPQAAPPLRLAAIAGACAVAGALLVAVVVRGCREGDTTHAAFEQRVSRIESLLGIADAGLVPPGDATPSTDAAVAVVSADDDHAPRCALAKIAAYQAWQDALSRAKANAKPAEAACADIWSDSRKQACYRTAMAEIRATQAARDAVVSGGEAARDALKNVKDNAKNDALARARAAGQTAFAACDEDGGS